MAIKLTDIQLKAHIERNQSQFNSMIEAANELAKNWLDSGFNPLLTDSLPDTSMADEWNPFLQSRYYKLYNELVLPVSITQTPFPGKAFKLFTGSFDVNFFTGEVTFNQNNLILFFNEEMKRHVEGLTFECSSTNKELNEQPLETTIVSEDVHSISDETHTHEGSTARAKTSLLMINPDQVIQSNHVETSILSTPEQDHNALLSTPLRKKEKKHDGSTTSPKISSPMINPDQVIQSNHAETSILSTPEQNHKALPSTPSSKKEKEVESNSVFDGISLPLLGGFMIALGASAVALGCILLINAATFGIAGIIVAAIGTASSLAGVGIFSHSMIKRDQIPIEADIAIYPPMI